MGWTAGAGRAEPPRLMMITDQARTLVPLPVLAGAVARGGVDVIQVREHAMTDAELVKLVTRVIDATASAGARVVVNERLDVALAAGAAGVHLKSNGLDPVLVRRAVEGLAPDGFLIGISVHFADELVAASRSGAVDYACVGPLHATGDGKRPLELEGLHAILEETRRLTAPCAYLALGGVGPADASRLAQLARPDERWGMAAVRPFLEAADVHEAEVTALTWREALDRATASGVSPDDAAS